MKRTGKTGAVAAALLLFVSTACSSPDNGTEDVDTTVPAPAPATEQQAAAPTDAEIAHIVVTANTIDVRKGELAVERGSDPQVKEFAETMIRDHTSVNESAVELVTRLGVTPQENDVSRSLESSATATRDSLASLSGAEFDRAYIANEVEFHQAVLDALDNLLIPNATNAELRSTLEGVRPAFEAHLRHAQSIQQSLGES